MTYSQFGNVQASDFNSLVGGNPTANANTLNAVWATGGGSAGYGQTAVANVAVGNTVATTGQWTSLISNTSNAAVHQGSSITSVTAPVAGNTITYLSAIPTNLTTIYSNRLNAATQGSTSSNVDTYNTTWSDSVTFTTTAAFANADAARYFFNSGGQIKLTFAQPTGTAMANVFSNLATASGTVVLSAPSSGTITVASTSYSGVTKIGGSGSATVAANTGYYGLSVSNSNVFTQLVGGVGTYNNSFIRVIAKTNGTQGSYADNGNVITVYTVWDEVPDGLTVTAGTNVTTTVAYPESTNLANTWGAVTLNGAGPSILVDYLVVAGGGAGSGSVGGGGGAGAYLKRTSQSVVTSSPYAITVGAGGSGASLGGLVGGSGSGSSFNSDSLPGGGGGGGSNQAAGASGGSGGGSSSGVGGQPSGGVSTVSSPVLGNNGGASGAIPANYTYAGGGGGSGGAGGSASPPNNGNGGLATSDSITGVSVARAGGGGAGAYSDQNAGTGGGGGATNGSTVNSSNADANSGSGSGGSGDGGSGIAGNGGSGVVIISYANSIANATATGTFIYTDTGGNHVFKFTAAGAITF